jgi:predicted AAA+ superfamily ATPase
LLDLRNDQGALWENFLAIERIKKQHYKNIFANNYFWRTWDQKEVDFVEERDGRLFGYEF